jgi:hypothetical protein
MMTIFWDPMFSGSGAGPSIDPGVLNVRLGVDYEIDGQELTGELETGTVIFMIPEAILTGQSDEATLTGVSLDATLTGPEVQATLEETV